MEDVKVIMLDDGISYVIVDEIDDYVYLTQEDNMQNFCIRKLVSKDDNKYLVALQDDDDFLKALRLFQEHHEIG